MLLSGNVVPVDRLSRPERARMYELLVDHFEGVTEAAFERDLREKQWAIVLRACETGQIVGFSTQTLLHATVAGRGVRALFSGDTIIDRRHWGDTELIRVWGEFALRLADDRPDQPLYWFLISMGYKTYRFLPLFFYEFYPRHDLPTPAREQEILDCFASSRYPDEYDSTRGVISPNSGRVRLRSAIAPIDAHRLRDPHVRFFAHKNQRHDEGEELACIAPLHRANLKPRAHAIIQSRATEPSGV